MPRPSPLGVMYDVAAAAEGDTSLRRAACDVRRVLRGFFYHTPHATRCLSSLLSSLFSWLCLGLAARAQSLVVIDFWSSRANPTNTGTKRRNGPGGCWRWCIRLPRPVGRGAAEVFGAVRSSSLVSARRAGPAVHPRTANWASGTANQAPPPLLPAVTCFQLPATHYPSVISKRDLMAAST
jgi:hypothetical protein